MKRSVADMKHTKEPYKKDFTELRLRLKKLYEGSSIANVYSYEDTFSYLAEYMEAYEEEIIDIQDFMVSSGMEYQHALSFLTLISVVAYPGEPILRIQYCYTCEEGKETILHDEDLQAFSCVQDCTCTIPVNLAEQMASGSENLLVSFGVHPSLAITL